MHKQTGMNQAWPEPYFALDPSAPNTLRLRASFSGITLTGNKPGLEWKYGTLLIGEEERMWFRKADRTQLFQLVTNWFNRKPELHASAFRWNPRIDLFLEPYSKTPEFTIYFADQNSAQTAHALLVRFQTVLPINVPPPAYTKTIVSNKPQTAIRGVQFIESKQRETIQQESKLALQAFSGDLSELQSRAKQVLDLVKKCAEDMQNSNRNERDAFDLLLADIGLVNNPVTKENSGKRYHELLSQQIKQFLLPKEESIVISLPDVFALYNRARAGGPAGLVSPQDVQLACEMLRNGEDMDYWEFTQSGVKCLRNKRLYSRIELVCNEILQTSEQRCVRASDLTKRLPVLSLIIAKEWLLEREHSGVLVRDVDAYGNVAWYANLFDQF